MPQLTINLTEEQAQQIKAHLSNRFVFEHEDDHLYCFELHYYKGEATLDVTFNSSSLQIGTVTSNIATQLKLT